MIPFCSHNLRLYNCCLGPLFLPLEFLAHRFNGYQFSFRRMLDHRRNVASPNGRISLIHGFYFPSALKLTQSVGT